MHLVNSECDILHPEYHRFKVISRNAAYPQIKRAVSIFPTLSQCHLRLTAFLVDCPKSHSTPRPVMIWIATRHKCGYLVDCGQDSNLQSLPIARGFTQAAHFLRSHSFARYSRAPVYSFSRSHNNRSTRFIRITTFNSSPSGGKQDDNQSDRHSLNPPRFCFDNPYLHRPNHLVNTPNEKTFQPPQLQT